MIDLSIVMDNGQIYEYNDIVSLTMQQDFHGGASIRFFAWHESKDEHKIYESSWSIGNKYDVESIVIKKGVR